ncbi:methylase involved in ubiquinone/menaquinone biosynthesis [Leptolyngbya sp. PCC 7375]|nr:methylase involved in ubiquinone/menaquinone biosynthesis [Leptolyngbya sp. PCC 7375]
MGIVDNFHTNYIFKRRVKVLSRLLSAQIPEGSRILDVGAGDGSISKLVADQVSGATIEGVDVLVRGQTRIPVKEFDGIHLPYETDSFDVVMFVDVLHHTHTQKELLEEAKRVCKHLIVIKDHNSEGFLAEQTLKFMDDVGNKKHGVVLPYVYLRKDQWERLFSSLNLKLIECKKKLGLYPFPLSLFFDRSLHMVTTLSVPMEH